MTKTRARIVAILILVAYSMLTYDITKNVPLGVTFDILSGLSVIGIAVLMYPLFNSPQNKLLNWSYLFCKIVEGALMIVGGLLILSPTLVDTRSFIYGNIHIYFFSLGAVLFYMLFARTTLIPKFISNWGIIASIILLAVTIIKLFGVTSVFLDVLVLPMILNEIFLAFWLIIKGFNKKNDLKIIPIATPTKPY